jgi:hypothetical protein
MSTADLVPPIDAQTVARVILHGDLSKLTDAQKTSYYRAVCESVGLNPLTQPFQYLVLNGREILYARREATEQLRRLHEVSITIVARELVDDIYVVTARATLPTGRTDENIGAVALGGAKGEARANGMMKAETKAKRRVTLAICGLGMLDETEVSDIPVPSQTGIPGPALVARSPLEEPALPPGPAAEPALPPDPRLVTIVSVTSKPTAKKGKTKHFIVLSNGEEVTTFNDWLASQAEQFHDAGLAVLATTEPRPWTDRSGIEHPETGLVALQLPPDPTLPLPDPAPTDDEIPF